MLERFGTRLVLELLFFQHLGMMEVVHAALGFTPSSPGLTLMQMVSRVGVVAILNECGDLRADKLWVPMMLFAWCNAEVCRYLFYAAGLFRDLATSTKGVMVAMKLAKVKSVEFADEPVFKIPFPLVWLRYSLFIVLYPMGVSGEMNCWRMAMNCLLETPSVSQPNTIGAYTMQSFRMVTGGRSYWPVLGTFYLFYVFGLPPLYMTLLGARKKQLAPAPKTDKAKKDR